MRARALLARALRVAYYPFSTASGSRRRSDVDDRIGAGAEDVEHAFEDPSPVLPRERERELEVAKVGGAIAVDREHLAHPTMVLGDRRSHPARAAVDEDPQIAVNVADVRAAQ